MANNPSNFSTDPLDEILENLSSGAYQDQTLNEFTDTVFGYNQAKQNTSRNAQRATYSSVKPTIKPSVEVATYPRRYDQVLACLNNLNYDNYPQEKLEGYKPAIEKYIDLVQKHPNDLRPVESQLNIDINSGRSVIRKASSDSYAAGYYDALLMVKKILRNSKQSKLRELSHKINNAK